MDSQVLVDLFLIVDGIGIVSVGVYLRQRIQLDGTGLQMQRRINVGAIAFGIISLLVGVIFLIVDLSHHSA